MKDYELRDQVITWCGTELSQLNELELNNVLLGFIEQYPELEKEVRSTWTVHDTMYPWEG